MKWMTTKETAELWGITDRQVQMLCTHGRVDGAQRLGYMWVIPKGAMKPKVYTSGWRSHAIRKRLCGLQTRSRYWKSPAIC